MWAAEVSYRAIHHAIRPGPGVWGSDWIYTAGPQYVGVVRGGLVNIDRGIMVLFIFFFSSFHCLFMGGRYMEAIPLAYQVMIYRWMT